MVVDHGELAGEHHDQLWDLEVVDGAVGQPLEATHHVVAEVAHHAGVEGGQAVDRLGGQFLQGLAEHLQRVPVVGDPDQFAAEPLRAAAGLGQRGDGAHADEGPA